MTQGKIVYLYLTLVRHGETSENVNNIIQGHLDTDLSSVGVKQALELKQHLSHLKPDFLISSDLKRASNTASALGLSTPLQLDARLRERDFGAYCGAARRELQQFAQANANSGNGCDGWRSVGAECSHQMAARTNAFLLELCSRIVKSLDKQECGTKSLAQSPILNPSKMAPMPQPVIQAFKPTKNFVYAGHVMMVSHGGWIRQLLRLLAFQSKQSANFPKDSANSVIRNCAICQIGLAFDPVELDTYISRQQNSATRDVQNASPLPAFGTLYDNGAQVSCGFAHLASPQLPLITICYHFNVTAADLEANPLQTSAEWTELESSLHPAVTLCSNMEVIFSDDGDEYAGQPDCFPPTCKEKKTH